MTIIGRLVQKTPVLTGIALCIAAVLAGTAIRYWFYEPDIFGAICYAKRPWWCIFRTFIAVEARHYGAGWTALALALIAVIQIARGRRANAFAYGALVIGGMGLILYDTTVSAPAVLIAALSLVRAPERTA